MQRVGAEYLCIRCWSSTNLKAWKAHWCYPDTLWQFLAVILSKILTYFFKVLSAMFTADMQSNHSFCYISQAYMAVWRFWFFLAVYFKCIFCTIISLIAQSVQSGHNVFNNNTKEIIDVCNCMFSWCVSQDWPLGLWEGKDYSSDSQLHVCGKVQLHHTNTARVPPHHASHYWIYPCGGL